MDAETRTIWEQVCRPPAAQTRFARWLSRKGFCPAGSMGFRMGQNFIDCDREQAFLMPPSLRDWLAEDIWRGS